MELKTEKEEHAEILNKMKKKPVTLFHHEVKKLRNALIQMDKISVPQFRLLLLLSGAKLKDFFIMDKEKEIALPILPEKGMSRALCKQHIMENVEGKRRKVVVEQEHFSVPESQKQSGGATTNNKTNNKDDDDWVPVPRINDGLKYFGIDWNGNEQGPSFNFKKIGNTFKYFIPTLKNIKNPQELTMPKMVFLIIILYFSPNIYSMFKGTSKHLLRRFGIKKYWGKESALYEALEAYNLEHIMNRLRYEGYTSMEALKELDEYEVGALMELMRLKQRTKYGDERVRFMDMLSEYDDFGERLSTSKPSVSSKASKKQISNKKRKSQHKRLSSNFNTQVAKRLNKRDDGLLDTEEQIEDGDDVLPFNFAITVPVMLAFFMMCTMLTKTDSFPKAFGNLGNTTFAKIFEHPEKHKTIIPRDIHTDEKNIPYDGCLERFDYQLHTIFEEHGHDINKLYYKLLYRYARQNSLTRRNVLPLHLMRNNGEIRRSVNEIARAIKHHYETSNIIGITMSKISTLFGTRKKRQRSSRPRTQKRKSSS